MNEVTLRIINLVRGGTSQWDYQYVVEYDPRGPGEPLLITTSIKDQARHFIDHKSAMEYWRQPRGTNRPDGKPDRPLTAFTVEVEPC